MKKRIHLTLPDWMRREMKSDDPERVRELITKGLMFERERRILNNNKQEKSAVSETWARDHIERGIAGFPDLAV